MVILGGGATGWAAWLHRSPAPPPLPIPGERDSGTVEVLNATAVDGLAREVTRRLRRAGIDVVAFGSARDSTLDSTTIVIRRGDSTVALRVRGTLGFGRIVTERNPRLLLDASVLIGRDLPRALGLHP